MFTIKTDWINKKLFLSLSLLIIPALIGCQAFLPGVLQPMVLYGRLILAPILVFILLRKDIRFSLMAPFFCYILILTTINSPINIRDYQLIVVSYFCSIAYFKLGHHMASKPFDGVDYRYLAYGVNLFNLITLTVYFMLALGYIDMASFFKYFSEDDKGSIFGIWRFSLGNSIEYPFVFTVMLLASIRLKKEKERFLFSTALNLFVTIISQSRLVVFIALILFLSEFMKSSWKNRLVSMGVITSIVLISLPFFSSDFVDIFFSLSKRLSGEDYGSQATRLYYLNLFLENINPLSLITGNGLTASTMLMHKLIGSYSTNESMLLAMSYELGIIGSLLFLSSMYLNRNEILYPDMMSITIILILMQMLLLINMSTLTPVIFFLLGVTAKKSLFLQRMTLRQKTLEVI